MEGCGENSKKMYVGLLCFVSATGGYTEKYRDKL